MILKIVGEMREELIPGLPDEIALDCLVRVPYRCHSALKLVCRGWNRLLTHPEFYHQRKQSHRAEAFVCLIQAVVAPTEPTQLTDTSTESEKEKARFHHYCPPGYGLTVYSTGEDKWRRIPHSPILPGGIPMFCHCVAVAAKLVLIGGWDPTTLDSVADVYVYDFVGGGGWRRGAPMSVARSFFACAAVGSSVYVAGGHDNQKNALRSAEVYDVDSDTWQEIPPMGDERDECQGLAGEQGRFWVVSGYGTDQQGRFDCAAECYDPELGTWVTVDGVWPFPNTSPRGSCCEIPEKNNFFPKTRSSPTEITKMPFPSLRFVGHDGLREYDHKDKIWKITAPVPKGVGSSLSAAVLESGSSMDQVFMIGSGEINGGPHRHRTFMFDAGSKRWTHIDTPVEFSGFVFSASSLCI